MKTHILVPTYLLFYTFCCAVSCNVSSKEHLPIYHPSDFNPLLVDSHIGELNGNHFVADFSLINQNGDSINQKDYEGKIYVTDFMFTRCPTICPVMTNHMRDLQEEFKDQKHIAFLSISVTPEIDSVSILKEYAEWFMVS